MTRGTPTIYLLLDLIDEVSQVHDYCNLHGLRAVVMNGTEETEEQVVRRLRKLHSKLRVEASVQQRKNAEVETLHEVANLLSRTSTDETSIPVKEVLIRLSATLRERASSVECGVKSK